MKTPPVRSGLLLLTLTLTLTGCLATASQRFPPDVAAALARSPMRRLETQSLYIYYPAGRGDEARRVGERLEGCILGLRMRARVDNSFARQKMVVILPEVPFNNAFVAPTAGGYEAVSVIPTVNTWDFQTELGIPPDPSFIGCHEITHYVQGLQVSGFWRVVNAVFGDVLTPQIGLDAWFFEGVATYYESFFQPGTGRMSWPMWRGFYHAGVAGHRVRGGDLSEHDRDFHFGGHYLYGSQFIEFLIERHGEHKLWQLIAEQGDSWVFFLFVSHRFYSVYGRSLSTLIDDFADWTARKYPVVARPSAQQRLRELGGDARYARSPGGREAFVVADVDRQAELWIVDASGRRERTRRLNQLLPWRELANADPVFTSGLSFTADGAHVFFAVVDTGLVEQEVRLVRYDVAEDRLTIVRERLGGPGGAVSPDGRLFWFALADGDRHHLAELELASGKVRVLLSSGPRQYVSAARPSPDGSRLVVSLFDGQRWTVWIVDAASGKRLAEVPAAAGASGALGALADASWADAHRVVYLGEGPDRKFQVLVHDVDAPGATPVQVTQAPYLAFAPQAAGERVRFLNRDGWSWTLDEAPLPAAVVVAPVPAPADPADPADPAPADPAAPAAPAGGEPYLLDAPPPPAAATPVAAAPAAAPAAPITAPLRIVSDEPYSSFDHLFYPQLRSIVFGGTVSYLQYGLSIGGGDRLGFHRWALAGLYQPDTDIYSGTFQYLNAQLAPWTLVLAGSDLRWHEDLDGPGTSRIAYEHRQRDAALLAGRAWGGLELALGASFTEDRQPDAGNPRLHERRLAGGTLALGYTAIDGTRHAGAQRLLAARAEGAFYPDDLGTLDGDLADARVELRVRFPPPVLRLHTFELRGRGRALLGDGAEDGGFLQVGGASAIVPLGASVSLDPDPEFRAPVALPPTIAFYEPLRGFEDLALTLDRVAIVDASYAYPIIFDHGFASSLYVLPAFFVRQLDLEVFASGASDFRTPSAEATMAGLERYHAATGAAVTLRTVFWRIPLDLRYQIARRLTDDRGLVQEFGLLLSF